MTSVLSLVKPATPFRAMASTSSKGPTNKMEKWNSEITKKRQHEIGIQKAKVLSKDQNSNSVDEEKSVSPAGWSSLWRLAEIGPASEQLPASYKGSSAGNVNTSRRAMCCRVVSRDHSDGDVVRNAILLTVLASAATTTSGELRSRLFFTLYQLHAAAVIPIRVHERLCRLLHTLCRDDDGGLMEDDEMDGALLRGAACVDLGKRRDACIQVCRAWLDSAATASDIQQEYQGIKEDERTEFIQRSQQFGIDPKRTANREFDLWIQQRRLALPRRAGNEHVWDDPEFDFGGQRSSPLRFAIGDKVQVFLGNNEGWLNGTVVDFHYREYDWQPNDFAPYQVALDDDMRLIFAPEDDDALIRARKRTQRSKTGNKQRPNLTLLSSCMPCAPSFSDQQQDHTSIFASGPSSPDSIDQTHAVIPIHGKARFCTTDISLISLFDVANHFGLERSPLCTETACGEFCPHHNPLINFHQSSCKRPSSLLFDSQGSRSFDDLDDDSDDDVLPCLFDLVKRTYTLAAEKLLRFNVIFDFGQGAIIDTSLALIHVRRVDLSRALSNQLLMHRRGRGNSSTNSGSNASSSSSSALFKSSSNGGGRRSRALRKGFQSGAAAKHLLTSSDY